MSGATSTARVSPFSSKAMRSAHFRSLLANLYRRFDQVNTGDQRRRRRNVKIPLPSRQMRVRTGRKSLKRNGSSRRSAIFSLSFRCDKNLNSDFSDLDRVPTRMLRRARMLP